MAKASPVFVSLLLLLLFFQSIGSVALAQSAAGDENAAPTEPGAVAIDRTARDSDIEERLAGILEATGWYTGIGVRADEGIVFLEGVAATDRQKTWARDLASKTEQVVAVVNNIRVDTRWNWSIKPATDALAALARDMVAALPLVVLALILIPVFWLLARWVRRGVRWGLGRRVQPPMLVQLIGNVVALPVMLVGIYIVLQIAGLTSLALSVLGGAGVIGIVVGFAFRDIAENFLAGILLSIRQPFQRGDMILVAGHQGMVRNMNSRSTILVSLEGNHIVIPNAAVFKSVIVNFSSAPHRRETLQVGIGYDDSVASAQTIISRVLADHPAVQADPAPMVLVDSLGAATVNLRVYFWFDGHVHSPQKVKSALYRLLKRALIAEGISMPDEAREVVFPQGVPIVTSELPSVPQTAGPERAIEPAPPLAVEPDAMATAAEGGLTSEEGEAEAQAAEGIPPEGARDILPPSDAGDRRT